MRLKVRTYQADNIFFGPNATNAVVEDTSTNPPTPVKDCGPPFARLQAWWYVIRHFGG